MPLSAKKLLLFIIGASLSACITVETRHPATVIAENFSELGTFLQRDQLQLKDFAKPGPFTFDATRDFRIRLSAKTVINTDLFLSSAHGKSPLVIISHGNASDKTDHQVQGEHLASWGMHSLVLQLPNRDQWLANGDTIKRLVAMIHAWPSLLNNRVDLNRVILVGHSFGGSAVSLAAATGANVKGVVLLDPAVYDKAVELSLKKNQKPIVLIGADYKVFRSKRRPRFFANTAGPMAEVSVRNATHNDAQYPRPSSWQQLAISNDTSEARQRTFLAALTAASFSIAATGKFDHAWQVFSAAIDQKILIDPRRK